MELVLYFNYIKIKHLTNFEIINNYILQSKTVIKSILILGSGSSLEFLQFVNDEKVEKLIYVDKFSIFPKILDELKPSYTNGTNKELDDYDKLFNEIIDDEDFYKLYDFFCKKRSINHRIEKKTFEKKTKFCTLSIQNAFKRIEGQFDLIVISKALSHIPDTDTNDLWILDQTKKRLANKGIVFLKVNGENYPIVTNNRMLNTTQPLRNYPKDKLFNLISGFDIVVPPQTIEIKENQAEEYWTIITNKK